LYATDDTAGDFTPVGNENAIRMRFDHSAASESELSWFSVSGLGLRCDSP
jgi:hypothetical protein